MTNFSKLWDERMDYECGSPLCDVCGKPVGGNPCDVHESIVRKGVAQGWSKKDRGKIFVSCNCHLVHRQCHKQAHANPELMVAIQIVRYGYETISEWIEGLSFKVCFAWARGLDEDTARVMVEEQAPWILTR